MAKITVEPSMTRLSEALKARMEDKGLSTLDLAKKTGMSYEHTRGIIKGERPPSHLLLKALCDVLKLPYQDMLELSQTDEIKKRYGSLPEMLAGKKPGMEPLERVWDSLTEEQQHDIVSMAQAWAKRSRRGV